VGFTRLRRPPAPTDAERARSIACRGGTAALVGTGAPEAVVPLVHQVRADGSALLLLDASEPLLDRVEDAPRGELPVMLELTDRAPVELREPVRGVLWITGWLRLLDPAAERRAAVRMAEERPHPRLLDLGHGARLVRLHASSAVISDAEGSAPLSVVDLAGARPDPFCRMEGHWLAHLETAHPEVFDALARHLPHTLRDLAGARVRPLGVDRCGIRLRIEAAERDHDVRLAWRGGATTVDELRVELARLVGCPFRTAQTPPPAVADEV
jgi:hypothetical protein